MTDRIRAVLVDDDAAVRNGVRSLLGRSGRVAVVAECADVANAQQAVDVLRPEVALVGLRPPSIDGGSSGRDSDSSDSGNSSGGGSGGGSSGGGGGSSDSSSADGSSDSGLELSRWVRAAHPQTAVLLLSAVEDARLTRVALEAGAGGYALTTASPSALAAAVEAVVAGYTSVDPSVTARLLGRASTARLAPTAASLTDREREVLTLVAAGATNRTIGGRLHISERTVQGHLRNVFAKLDAATRTDAVVRAARLGLVALDPEESAAGRVAG